MKEKEVFKAFLEAKEKNASEKKNRPLREKEKLGIYLKEIADNSLKKPSMDRTCRIIHFA